MKLNCLKGNKRFIHRPSLYRNISDFFLSHKKSVYRVVIEEHLAPLVVDKEEEGEDGDDEACGDHNHHNKAAIHVLSCNQHLIIMWRNLD